MGDAFFWLFWIPITLLTVGIAWVLIRWQRLKQKKRLDTWRRIAGRIGATFQLIGRMEGIEIRGRDVWECVPRSSRFGKLSAISGGYRCHFLLQGTVENAPFTFIDLDDLSSGSEGSATPPPALLCIVELRSREGRRVTIRNRRRSPKGRFRLFGLSRPWEAAGLQFPEDPELTKSYVVEGKSDREVRATLNDKLRELFRWSNRSIMFFELAPEGLLFVFDGSSPDNIPGHLVTVKTVIEELRREPGADQGPNEEEQSAATKA
jgi:hypothetical protein